MSHPNPSTAMARAVIDEMARWGVDFITISPGSRSAALAIAAAEHPAITERVVLDERSAAFCALGRAKASGRPAAVVSTSGTAPANFFPAVVEADMSLVPLVVLSADRPDELRGVGANQTIDQTRLYGNKVRHFVEFPAPDTTDRNDFWRSQVSAALARALGLGDKPGPVQLNLAFREPTVPVVDDGRTLGEPYPHATEGREGGARWGDSPIPGPPVAEVDVAGEKRGVVIAGDGRYDRKRLLAAAAALGFPVLATALSGLRGAAVVSGYHHLLAGGVPDSLRPELIIAIGPLGPSPRLDALVSAASIRIRIDYWGRNIDPKRDAAHRLHADPVATLEALAKKVAADPGWAAAWEDAEAALAASVEGYFRSVAVPTGASVARALNGVSWEYLVAASSLPIREVDAHLQRAGFVVANRGASGIDGFVSTGIGVASLGRPTVALAGDLSLLHDCNGFLSEGDEGLVIVVLDNGGGGLFDDLPQARHAPEYERLFFTPHHRRFSELARFHRLGFAEVDKTADVAPAVEEGLQGGGRWLVRVPIDRDVDRETRRALDELGAAVADSVET
ncbi:MAG: 2-succinyl-5-enolpyruvyl-6-hydroxy-3-cyclohexene-1-carboxylic-acid synthase [Acidimicrobiia bacterium]